MMKKIPLLVVGILALSHAAQASNGRMGLGLTTLNMIGTSPAFSAWMELNPSDSVQGFVGIPSTSPFQFGVGGGYRHIISGTQATGLHVGGGLNFGTIQQRANEPFFFAISALAGLHFGLPNLKEIGASLDGGANFTVIDGNFNFSLTGLSPSLGLSIHYFF
jgi:hypothetical protein